MDAIRDFQQSEEQHQTIKPSINTALLLLHAFGLTVAIFFTVAMFLVVPMVSLISQILGVNGLAITIISSLILFALIMMICYFVRKATLVRTEYRFYSDRIEYYEGFLVKNRKTVSYDKISNIGQRKGIIEGWFGLGTIFIDTPGSSPKGHEVSISYLENPDQVYDWINKVISKKR